MVAVTVIELLSLLAILAVVALASWLVDKLLVVVPEDRVAAWGIILPATTRGEDGLLRDELWVALEALGYPIANREHHRDHPRDSPEQYYVLSLGNLEMLVGVHIAGANDTYVSWNVVIPQRTYWVWQLHDLGLNELNRTRAFASAGLEAVQHVVLTFLEERRQLEVAASDLEPSGTLGALHHARG